MGEQLKVDLVGGYYDAGDNVKFHFPMAYTTTMLAWGVLEFGEFMGSDLQHAHEAIRWATDYFLKATRVPGDVYAQVGDPYGDHNCWERPEDMETPRTTYAVMENKPGSEVSAEIAAALAASSMVFYGFDRRYSKLLLRRASRKDQIRDNAPAGSGRPINVDVEGDDRNTETLGKTSQQPSRPRAQHRSPEEFDQSSFQRFAPRSLKARIESKNLEKDTR
ncbi:hypothetical protein HYC85_013564 [Camellia sinensis]|uniref:cellulase n=1 Tax=Camellia sinensis TaxID=4442 RepID=A0A7J7H4Y0_CAMSI|nr:hypothetical protein HYC85_013564 [Camellia sinensis]